MNNKDKKLRSFKEKTLPLRPLLWALGLFGFFFITLVPLALIIINGDKIGWIWVPLAVLYMALFIAANAVLIRRKRLDQIHFTIGDELFYQQYPREYARDQRKKLKRQQYLRKQAEKRAMEAEKR